MSPRKTRKREFRVRLYQADGDLVALDESMDGLPYGAKSQRIKELVRLGLAAERGEAAAPRDGAAWLPAAAAPALDLAELRQVVEAAVDTALGRFEGQVGGGMRTGVAEEDDETEALLDGLEAALVLEDDE